jgi:uncharacterized NAD(P)/FAD-binding protein YdhS
MSHVRTVCIVGAGFSGTMLAAQLLRTGPEDALRIVLVNRPAASRHQGRGSGRETGALARGLAYGTDSPDHLLNVPAARMSAWPTEADDFVRFLRAQGPAFTHADDSHLDARFVPRHWYGRYLRHVLESTRAAYPRVALDVRFGNVVDLRPSQPLPQLDSKLIDVLFDDGQTLRADAVALAVGNFAPAHPATLPARIIDHPRYVRDPWDNDALARTDLGQPVLLLGTGLTMYDVVLSLSRRLAAANTAASKPLQLLAISRRGLLPQPHRIHTATPHFDEIRQLGTPSARGYLHALRARIAAAAAAGLDWRDVLAALRPATPMLWHALPDVERARFLRHLKPYWESHRHRAAPEIAQTIEAARQSGTLSIERASLVNVSSSTDASALIVGTRARGTTQITERRFGTLINCTGPSARLDAEPLLATLAQRGVIAADAMQLGLVVSDDYRPAPTMASLFYVGPLLRARHWEATAVPELRDHVARCAREILDTVASRTA